ncbi:MAG: AAA family ATPase [Planctomycetales bacterium]|nr:AAA family ATPase [Planctomycetales bacterium]
MRIETIRVHNFKTLQSVELKDLPAFCVFVGRNGSGKTTLFRVFAFLKHCLEHNVRSALNAEGGEERV